MGHGAGVEHRQVPALSGLYLGGNPPIADELVNRHDFTTNQEILAAGLMLGRKDGKASPAAAVANLAEQRRVGHMSSEPDGANRNEIFAPAPHSLLIYFPMACIALWAKGDLRAAAVQWWADHFALVSAFWTPSGLAAPCGRFKWPAGMKAVPNHTLDNLAYAQYAGIPGDFGESTDVAMLAISAMLRELGDEIRAAHPDPVVAVQIGKWARPEGGYLAAFVGKPPMNDPLGRIEVDASGAIIDAAKSPGELPPIEGAILVGRLPSSAAPAPALPLTPSPSSVPSDPPAVPTPPAVPAPERAAGVIAADVLKLQVAGKNRSRLREIAMEISGAIKSWRSWADVADDLLSLGPQHADVQALADEVRRMDG